MNTLRDIVELYWALPDPRKAKAFHIEREVAIDLFYTEWVLHRHWFPTLHLVSKLTREQVTAMLEIGEGRILGLPVVLSDEPGTRVELQDG